MSDQRSQESNWVENAAGIWALIFGVVHLVWALGWYVGLDPETAREAFAKPGFMVYDLVIATMCLVAVPISQAFVRPWGRRLPRKPFAVVAWTGTSLLVVRAAAGLIQSAYLAVTGQFDVETRMVLMELWFYLGAALWGLSTWRSAHRGLPAAATIEVRE